MTAGPRHADHRAAEPGPARPGPAAPRHAAGEALTSEQQLSAGAVDVLDVAARLESSGISDRVAASRYGRADVFLLASDLHRQDSWRISGARRPGPSYLGRAVLRGLLLVAGVLLAAVALDALELSARMVWISGITGWIAGQVVAAVAWSRLGLGQPKVGLQRAGATTLLVLVLATASATVVLWSERPGALLTGVLLSLMWTGYACAVSLLVSAGRTWWTLLAVALGLAVAGAALALDRPWSSVAAVTAAAAAVLVVVLLAGWAVASAGGPARPGRPDWRSAAPAAGQAALLAASLLALLQTVPGRSAAPLVIASVVGAAVADPAIALLRADLQSSATRLYLVSAAARKARRAALLAAAGTAAVSALVAALVILPFRAGIPDWPTAVTTAGAFTAMATTAAALTAFGAPWRAVLTGGLAAVYAAAALLMVWWGILIAFTLCLTGAIALLLHQVSDPRVVA